jgi:hypothetical protein
VTQPDRSRSVMLTRLMIMLGLALGPLIYVEMEQQEAGAPEVVAASEAPATRPIAPPQDAIFTMPPRGTYDEVIARPPFSETRRPAPPGATAVANDQPLAVTVIGTIVAPGGVRALVEHGEPAQVTRVVEGQQIDGWTVKAILQEKIVLARSGTTIELKVKGSAQATAPAASMPSPSPSAAASRLTKVGALAAPLSPPGTLANRRATQPVAAAAPVAVAQAQTDPAPAQVVNADLSMSHSGALSRIASRRGR